MKKIKTQCPNCGKVHIFKVSDEQYRKYINGESYIQNIFSELTPGEREMLITGICPECWNKIFKEE